MRVERRISGAEVDAAPNKYNLVRKKNADIYLSTNICIVVAFEPNYFYFGINGRDGHPRIRRLIELCTHMAPG